jgi:outer membrane protein OmpA-like peptidoglycan-associated protein
VVNRWTQYRDFAFDANKSDLRTSETGKAAEIAAYLKQNPSLQVGLEGSMDVRGTDQRDAGLRDLSDRRVKLVRDALIQAGVPALKIKTGAFGDARRHDQQVAVLISTGG